tara:strand:+ start:2534 stop:3676 length:1143 start_codon:yes stop_codon:yes gene_type:complete
MHKLEIKHARGISNVFYHDNNSIIELVNSKGDYDILFIDSIIKDINKDLYDLSLSKSLKFIEVESGEKSKQIDNVFKVLNEIESMNIYPINRALVIGGGTIQDLAATCLGLIKRGTKWDFIPTTILAQCDSCIGSKTSINSRTAKNLYGLFYAPSQIHILNSIALKQSDEDLLSGYGDALHYLFLDPLNEYNYISKQIKVILKEGVRNYFKLPNEVINLARHCHIIKKDYIEKDEFDQSQRKNLNLGHSFGHAIEKLFDYQIPHGISVMHGIYMSYLLNIYSKGENINSINSTLSTLIKLLIDLLNERTLFTIENVQDRINGNIDLFLSILKKDKKNTRDKYILVLLSEKTYLKEFTYLELKVFLTKIASMMHDSIQEIN